jgi:hypothetical protein
MWVEKRREQLEAKRTCPIDDADWLCLLLDGVWLTREICAVVAVGIDAQCKKRLRAHVNLRDKVKKCDRANLDLQLKNPSIGARAQSGRRSV